MNKKHIPLYVILFLLNAGICATIFLFPTSFNVLFFLTVQFALMASIVMGSMTIGNLVDNQIAYKGQLDSIDEKLGAIGDTIRDVRLSVNYSQIDLYIANQKIDDITRFLETHHHQKISTNEAIDSLFRDEGVPEMDLFAQEKDQIPDSSSSFFSRFNFFSSKKKEKTKVSGDSKVENREVPIQPVMPGQDLQEETNVRPLMASSMRLGNTNANQNGSNHMRLLHLPTDQMLKDSEQFQGNTRSLAAQFMMSR